MIRFAIAFAAAAFAGPAGAAMAFKVQNASDGPASVTMDGKPVCAIAAGKSCTVDIADADTHAFAFSLSGGAPVNFKPGNLEMVDTCRLDASGAHCTDPTGAATN